MTRLFGVAGNQQGEHLLAGLRPLRMGAVPSGLAFFGELTHHLRGGLSCVVPSGLGLGSFEGSWIGGADALNRSAEWCCGIRLVGHVRTDD
jgi:hypothetical protein